MLTSRQIKRQRRRGWWGALNQACRRQRQLCFSAENTTHQRCRMSSLIIHHDTHWEAVRAAESLTVTLCFQAKGFTVEASFIFLWLLLRWYWSLTGCGLFFFCFVFFTSITGQRTVKSFCLSTNRFVYWPYTALPAHVHNPSCECVALILEDMRNGRTKGERVVKSKYTSALTGRRALLTYPRLSGATPRLWQCRCPWGVLISSASVGALDADLFGSGHMDRAGHSVISHTVSSHLTCVQRVVCRGEG